MADQQTFSQTYQADFRVNFNDLPNFSEHLKRLGVDANNLTGYFGKLTDIGDRLFNGTKGPIGEVTGGIRELTGAIRSFEGAQKFIDNSIQSFARFETYIARTGAIANASTAELSTLNRTAQDLGRTTEYSAAQVAESMGNLALAGFRVEEIVSAMPGLLATATAGALDLKAASGIAAQVLRTFHLEASQMNYVAGTLTATFTSTNTTLQELSYTMQYAGADANELGVSLSELAAAGGILGNVGIRGSIAGTGLREFIARIGATLAENTDKMGNAKQALQALGVTWREVSDEAGNLNLAKAVGALEHAFDSMGMTAEARLKALRPIFGARAGTQVTALISQGAEVLAAKDMEVAFGGAKQQLDGLLQSASRLPEGMYGITISSREIAENFIRIGSQGRANLDRITGQMRELGLVGGFLNSQVGITREIVENIDGKTVRRNVFVPMEELGTSTLRSIDALYRLRERLSEIGSEAEQLAILQDLFGSDERVLEQATRAMKDGGQAMAEFANNVIRSTSALDVQKKQLNTVSGSLELMRSALEGMRIQIGAVAAPLARIMAMAMAGVAQLVSGTTTLMGLLADFQENLGGIEQQLVAMRDALRELSLVGKIFAGSLLIVAGLPLVGLLSSMAIALSVLAGIGTFVTVIFYNLFSRFIGDAGFVTGLIGKYTDEFRELGSTVTGLRIIFDNISKAIAGLGGAFRAMGWAAFMEALVYTAYDLLPAILRGFTDIADRVSSFGEFSLAGAGIGASMGEIQMAAPDGGVLTALVNNLQYVIEGLISGFEFLIQAAIRLADAIVQATIAAVSAVIALIFDLVANLPKTLYTLYTGILDILYRIIASLLRVILSLLLAVFRAIIAMAALMLNFVYEIIRSGVRQIISTLQVLIVDFPTRLVNMMLHMIAFFTNILGYISTILIQIGAQIIANTINWSFYLLTTVIKITAYIALLPITLPYLFYKALLLVFDGVANRTRSGGEAIYNVVTGILSRLRTIAADFLNSIMAGIVRQLRSMFNMIIQIITGMFNIPVLVFNIAALVYSKIEGALSYIYRGIANWLDALPYVIAGYISMAWGFILKVISRVIGFFGDIIGFTGRLVISLFSKVFKMFSALVIELPFLILRIVVHAFAAFVAGFLNTIVIAISQIKNVVFNLITNFHIHFTTYIRRSMAIITNGIPALMNYLSNSAKTAIQRFGRIVTSIVEELPAWFANSIVKLAVWLRDEVLTLPMTIVTGILEALNNAFDTIMNVIENIILGLTNMSTAGMSNALNRVVNAAIRFLMDFPGLMIRAIARAWTVFVDGMERLYNRIVAVDWDTVATSLGNALSGIAGNISTVIRRIINTVIAIATGGARSFANAIRTSFTGAIGGSSGTIIGMFTGIFNKIVAAIKPSLATIFLAFQDLWKTLRGIAWWDDVILPTMNAFYDGIQLWLNNIQGWLDNLPTDGVWGVVKTGVQGVVDIIQAGINIARQLLTQIRNRWNDIMGALTASLTRGLAFGVKFILGGLFALGGVLLMLGRLAWSAIEAIAGLSGIFGDIVTDIASGDIQGAVDNIITAFTNFSRGDSAPLENALAAIMDTLIDVITSAFFGIYNTLLRAFNAQFPALGAIVRMLGFSIYVLGALFLGILHVADWGIRAVLFPLMGVAQLIVFVLRMLLGVLVSVGQAIIVFVTGILSFPLTFQNVLTSIELGFAKLAAGIMDTFDNAWNRLKNWLFPGSVPAPAPAPVLLPAPAGSGGGAPLASSGATAAANGGLPRFAAGGIVQRETQLVAGEGGPEAIIPISAFVGMIKTATGSVQESLQYVGNVIKLAVDTITPQAEEIADSLKTTTAVMIPATATGLGLLSIISIGTTLLVVQNAALKLIFTGGVAAVGFLKAAVVTTGGLVVTELKGVVMAIAAGTKAVITTMVTRGGLQGLTGQAMGLLPAPAMLSGAGGKEVIARSAGGILSKIAGFFTGGILAIKGFLMTTVAPFLLLMGKIILIAVAIYAVVGLITKLIEWATGLDLEGFFGPLKYIWDFVSNIKSWVYKKIGIEETKEESEKKNPLPIVISILERQKSLIDYFKDSSADKTFDQLQKLYLDAEKEFKAKKAIYKSNIENEKAQLDYENAANKFSAIGATMTEIFNRDIEKSFEFTKQQREEAYRSGQNYYNNFTLNLQTNNQDSAQNYNLLREQLEQHANRGNFKPPASRGGNEKYPGKNKSPVVGVYHRAQNSHRKG